MLAALLVGEVAEAAPPWVDRSLTLPRGDWAVNLGLGLAHGANGALGPGFNFEGAVGVTRALELGLRTGVRIGETARLGGADVYGRPFQTETYGVGQDTLANPEFYVRGALVQGDVVQLGLEGRVYTPLNSELGLMFGMPLRFRFGRVARLDTGVYVPILFHDQGPTETLVSFPFQLWIQMQRLWLGPISALRVQSTQGNRTEVLIGFGLGYQISKTLDFKTQLIFPDVAHGANPNWGAGAGIEVRIE